MLLLRWSRNIALVEQSDWLALIPRVGEGRYQIEEGNGCAFDAGVRVADSIGVGEMIEGPT